MKKEKKIIPDEYKREIILSHYENPINKINEEEWKEQKKEYFCEKTSSASCIDNFCIYMKIGNNVIKDIKFSGEGCAISTSSIDIMSNYLKNKKIDDGLKLINNYLDMVYGKNVNKDTIGDLISFENIYKQVNRIKCASIGIEGMKKIIIEISKKNKRNKN